MHIRRLLLAALVSAVTAAAGVSNLRAQTSSVKGRDYALIIATNTYEDEWWDDLENPLFDARAIKADLEQLYGFEVELVANPRLIDLQRKLREYVQQRKFADNDQLFIFFAGHGLFDPALNLGHIVARDSSSPKADDTLSTYFSFADLYRYVQRIPVKHLFLVLDVCHGGTFGDVMRGNDSVYRPATAAQRLATAMQRPSRKFLTSGGNEYVPDGRPGSHSPFAFRFIEALRTGGQDGILSSLQIIERVQTIQPNRPVWGDLAGASPGSDFLFVRRGVTTAPAPAAPATTSAAEEQFWSTVKDSKAAEAFAAYLQQYPAGKYAGAASERLRTYRAKEEEQRGGGTTARRDMDAMLRAMSTVMGAYGFGLNGAPSYGTLQTGATATLTLDLQGGQSYFLSIPCDFDCSDVDVRIYDQSRKEVASEVGPEGDEDMFPFKPPSTGRYTVRVEMVECAAEPCMFALGLFVPRERDARPVRVQLEELIGAMSELGTGFTTAYRDVSLRANTYQDVPLDVEAGDDFLVFALCDRNCGGLGLEAFNGAGQSVEKAEPYIPIATNLFFTAGKKDRMTMRVTMGECQAPRCDVSLAFVKRAQRP